ncbi:hypothetical protein ACJ41O_009370 [Fusarium nematophilum]
MDSLRGGLESRASSQSRMSTPARILARAKRKRPTISAPIGPIKNSRGPDFTRSETFKIVPAIKDCGSDESLPEKENVDAKAATRRISASFSTRGPLASTPTVAKSDIKATMACKIPTKTTPPKLATLKTASKATLNTSSSYSLFPSLETVIQDENVPPPGQGASSPPIAAPLKVPKNRLPKSRTLSVLVELKTSMSRPSLNARPANVRALGDQSRQNSRQVSSSSASTIFGPSASRIRLPRPSLTSMSRSSSSSTAETQPPPDPQQISTAQPSAYWSGRFIALHDRFMAEEFEKRMTNLAPAFPPGQFIDTQVMTPYSLAANFRPTHLSYSTTTSALTSLASSKPRIAPANDDNLCLRVFRHLDSLCTTNEARRSLHDWQQAYARRVGRANLLPQGGRMEDKSLMGKLFGGGSRKFERRSLSGLRETSSVPGGKKTKPIATVRGRGKRLTMN